MDDVGRPRDRWITALAILMGLMALSNFWKPVAQTMAPESNAGFVFFGTRLHGLANAVIGPLFGVLLAAYTYERGRSDAGVVPLASAYAGYVIVNLLVYTWNTPADQKPPMLGMIAYAAVAIGVSGGGAYYLWRRRDELR